MLAALASVAALSDEQFDGLAHSWKCTDEFEGWDATEILEILREVADLAESAKLERKTLLLWTEL